MFAIAIWITTPAIVLILRARIHDRLWLPAVLAAGAIALPSLMHGGNGYTQFGYRHTLDYMPFLLLLVGIGMRGKITAWMRALIIASITVNLWGVLMISRFGIFGLVEPDAPIVTRLAWASREQSGITLHASHHGHSLRVSRVAE
jgi:hypothetical protein